MSQPARTLDGGQAHPALDHQPALDGLRGLAVLAVLLFHGGVSWAVGGFLGVSAFFTLSGFLITSVTLARWERTGRVDLRDFWVRRARRLLPAAWLCLLGIMAYGLTVAPQTSLDTLPGDVLAGLGYVANWRLIATGSSYEALFSAPSPTTHLWSLAVEEQFYVLFPVVALVALGRRGSPRRLAIVLACGAAASALAMVVLHEPGGSTARAYYGTDARAAEILIGALAAVVWRERRRLRPDVTAPGLPLNLAIGGLLGVGLFAWMSLGSTSPGLYTGGFLLHAIGVALLIPVLHRPGPWRRAFSISPLRGLGLISYGVYLYHWPIFLVLDESRTGWTGPWLLVARLAVTLAAATLSYLLVEHPIRSGQIQVPVRVALAGAAAVAVLAGSLGAVSPAPRNTSFASGTIGSPVSSFDDVDQPTPVDDELDDVEGPPRVAVFGDSTALHVGAGIRVFAQVTGEVEWGGGEFPLGCGVGRGGDRVVRGVAEPIDCPDWSVTWSEILDRNEVDLSVVVVGPWEVVDRRLDGDSEWRTIGDPVYDEFLRSEIRAATDVLSQRSGPVVWLTSPPIDPVRETLGPTSNWSEADPERMARFNELLVDEISRHPSPHVHVVDVAGYLEERYDGQLGRDVRHDGVHLTLDAAVDVAEWLVPQLLVVEDQVRTSGAAGSERPGPSR